MHLGGCMEGIGRAVVNLRIQSFEEAISNLDRVSQENNLFTGRVTHIINQVRDEGDKALAGIALYLNDPLPCEVSLSDAEKKISLQKLRVLKKSAENIRIFAEKTAESASPFEIDYPTHRAGMRWQPVNTAGCYVPGGRFPLASTALMTVIAAKAAGVNEIIVCSPDSSEEILAACSIAGADRFFRIGGAQAIAAMAFGTETVPRANVIAGPGNRWVSEAKRQMQGTVGIDMLAGPSEVAVLVNSNSSPSLAAIDLLAQAEHDPESNAWCISLCKQKAEEIILHLKQLAEETGIQAVDRIHFLLASSVKESAEFCNKLAPEHLQLSVENPNRISSLFTSYGAVFLGERTCVPMGDYSAGPNHTLPTSGTASFSGGLTPLTFMRPQAWVENSGSELPQLAADFACFEGLTAHERSCRIR